MTTKHVLCGKQAVGYVRVSTQEQVEGISPAAQTSAIEAYCTMRKLNLVTIVVDPGVSGGRPLAKRRGGSQVLKLVREKKVDAVVSYKLDRLFRDASDCLLVTKAWDESGIALHLIDLGGQAVDTTSPMGRFFLTVMAGAAEMERSLISERTCMVLKYKRDRGERLGMIPYGFQCKKKSKLLEPNPNEQKVIMWIKECRIDGFTAQEIVDELNNEHIPARGKCWHVTTVRRILRRVAAVVDAAKEKE